MPNAEVLTMSDSPAQIAKDMAPANGRRPDDIALLFEGVSMVFPDGTQALDRVDLAIRPGEFVSLVGPSGCGKSTLLRLAAGLETQTAGDIWVDRDSLGYTFQDATLLPWRKVLPNVELLMELRGFDPAERRRIAQEQIELVGLTGFENHYPRRLSGGMKMRASLARSLALNPAVFLFDEPFGALDEITRERLNDELIALYIRQQFTGLFVTHSIPEAVYLSSRVVVMSRRPGHIVASFDIAFPEPRGPELRYTSRFAEICGEISLALRKAMEG
ncbi:ABC transporter ATP-binding protein [Devosia yakushimensis]|uniref:ABC transporter ATP-binding protein n=2 Tax=Devosia yakushimensis TaxID=470028 RepID=A0ABQ5UFY8_9HYPH|nr:ABC transporter ATP-binding protein [Devosia yakushimensis]